MRERNTLSSAHGRWLAAAAAAVYFATASSGCIIGPNECGESGYHCGGGVAGNAGGPSETPNEVVLAVIDVDQTLDTTPGEGIGAFIEYAEGGRWHVFTACDTDLTGLPCSFNVIATVPAGSTYQVSLEESLESDDVVYQYDDGVELVTVTGSDTDGIHFKAPPGDVVRFEVWVDDKRDARFIYWVGGGAVHHGAPTNPIDLKPSSS